CGLLGPHDYPAPRAGVQRIGVKRSVDADRGLLSVENVGVLALKVAADADSAASGLARRVDRCTHEPDLAGQEINLAADLAGGRVETAGVDRRVCAALDANVPTSTAAAIR